jgi:hypothetical protein
VLEALSEFERMLAMVQQLPFVPRCGFGVRVTSQ